MNSGCEERKKKKKILFRRNWFWNGTNNSNCHFLCDVLRGLYITNRIIYWWKMQLQLDCLLIFTIREGWRDGFFIHAIVFSNSTFWGGEYFFIDYFRSFLNQTKISILVSDGHDDGRFFWKFPFLKVGKKETRRKLPNQTYKKSCSPVLLLEKGLTLFHTYVENDIDIRSSRLAGGSQGINEGSINL